MKRLAGEHHPPRLEGSFPVLSFEDHNGDPLDEPIEVVHGRLRIVHKQRARKLRRRGEHLIDFRRSFPQQGFKACYGWCVLDVRLQRAPE